MAQAAVRPDRTDELSDDVIAVLLDRGCDAQEVESALDMVVDKLTNRNKREIDELQERIDYLHAANEALRRINSKLTRQEAPLYKTKTTNH